MAKKKINQFLETARANDLRIEKIINVGKEYKIIARPGRWSTTFDLFGRSQDSGWFLCGHFSSQEQLRDFVRNIDKFRTLFRD